MGPVAPPGRAGDASEDPIASAIGSVIARSGGGEPDVRPRPAAVRVAVARPGPSASPSSGALPARAPGPTDRTRVPRSSNPWGRFTGADSPALALE